MAYQGDGSEVEKYTIEILEKILLELRKANIHNEIVTNLEIDNEDLEG